MPEESPEHANLLVFDSAAESVPEFDISDPEAVRMLEESQRSHFWFDARNRQILDFLRREGAQPPARVLEVGCGTGTVLSALARAGYLLCGVEMHLQLARRAAKENPGSRVYVLDVRNPPARFVDEGGFDVVALFDVVEHLADPEGFLRACAALLRPGGLLVGTVPALEVLWTDYDAFSGHALRYDRRTLEGLFARAGLPAVRTSYFFQVLLPGMLGRRILIGRGRAADTRRRRTAQHIALDPPGRALNGILQAACAAERALRRGVSLDGVPGASLWFSSAIPDPGAFKVETRATAHTDGKR